MLIDCHVHVAAIDHAPMESLHSWFTPFGLDPAVFFQSRDKVESDMRVGGIERSVILAFDAARSMGILVPNDFVASLAEHAEGRLIPFASVDPLRPDAMTRLEHAIEVLGMAGLKLAPTYQWFDPLADQAMAMYQYCDERGIPILLHQGPSVNEYAKKEYQDLSVIKTVADRFPTLRIILAHLPRAADGYLISLLRDYPNVLTDTSGVDCGDFGLAVESLTAFLMQVRAEGLISQLCWGSDSPWSTPADARRYVVTACERAGFTGDEIRQVLGGSFERLLSTSQGAR